jgi:uncharacterized protein (TIGR02145 family)
MKKIVLKYLLQVFVMRLLIPYLLVLLFVACGDDDSDSVIRPSGGSSSDVILSSDSHEQSSSSSSSSSTKSSSSDADSEYNAEAKTLKDSRDGQTYKTVQIGSRTWMAQNLNYKSANSYCYNDNANNCTKYGRLYTWAAAVGKSEEVCDFGHSCSLPSGNIQGVCPSGWHLPSDTEWDTLFMMVGGLSFAGSKLKSTSGWDSDGNGTDAFGFSALPAGDRNNNGNFDDEGIYANFWSSTEHDSNIAYNLHLAYIADGAYMYGSDKYNGYSVRCVKD